ncbi:flavodoxin [Enterococcus sp. AZ109]|uniref:flavodoxin n=1 Tax=Enterococcus sp. AZ109 TaxID=2774634 RepID=UPI003F266B26
MRKKLIMLLGALLFLGACSSQADSESESSNAAPPENREEARVLVTYFTWGENVGELDESSIDVDATTSASLALPGNVGKMAQEIGGQIEADQFSIQTVEPYSSDYDDCLDRASEEKGEDARPALTAQVEGIDQYDVVFLGYPDWWASAPMALFTFIEENDLSDKEVILFCSHGTSGLGSSVRDIQEQLPESTSLNENVLGVAREDSDYSEATVTEWLQTLGF